MSGRHRDPSRYGNQHKILRKQWARVLASGTPVYCGRGGELLDPDQPWDLDHLESGESRPSCATHNRGAPGLRNYSDPPANPVTRW